MGVWVSIGGLELFVAAFFFTNNGCVVVTTLHFFTAATVPYHTYDTSILLCLCWLLLPGRVMLILARALSRDLLGKP